MSIKQNLINARALIEKPENWIKGDYTNDDRTCFCILGAIAEVKGIEFFSDVVNTEEAKLLKELSGVHDSNTVAVFNDQHTHFEVLELFDKAIANL